MAFIKVKEVDIVEVLSKPTKKYIAPEKMLKRDLVALIYSLRKEITKLSKKVNQQKMLIQNTKSKVVDSKKKINNLAHKLKV